MTTPRMRRHYVGLLAFFTALSLLLPPQHRAWGKRPVAETGGARLIDRQGRLWEAALPGLWLTEGQRQTHFTTRNGLPNDTVTTLAESLNGQVWIGTRNGLLVYDEAGFRELSYSDGLLSKRINHLYQGPEGPLWVATSEGAFRYANHRLLLSEALRAANVRYVGEADEQWVFVTDKGVVRLPQERSVSAEWLAVLGGGLVVVGGGIALTRRNRRLRRDNQLQTQLVQAEQKALLAQMNPHFVFNSLNSIQKFILRHEAEAAQDYLTKFGRLMRTILEQSRQPLLPLAEEAQMLRDYLELEALRFEGQFTYAVEVEAEELLAEEIPGMLIHPFVENAVWHGLSHHQGRGHIQVRFTREGLYVVATVQDNGIGRARAAARSGSHAGYPSRGTQIVAERVALLNHRAPHPIQMEITDLTTPETTAGGTRVVIRIPRQHS